MYDQLGGGFARYAVDAIWLVPHFEKMLYDNAQLARIYLDAFRAFGTERYRDVATETLDYVLREMTGAEGGFYSAQDADTEGEEGKFYVWTSDEIDDILGPDDGEVLRAHFGVTDSGNFEGKNILTYARTAEEIATAMSRAVTEVEDIIAAGRQKLFDARANASVQAPTTRLSPPGMA